jgi:hypothetical protein
MDKKWRGLVALLVLLFVVSLILNAVFLVAANDAKGKLAEALDELSITKTDLTVAVEMVVATGEQLAVAENRLEEVETLLSETEANLGAAEDRLSSLESEVQSTKTRLTTTTKQLAAARDEVNQTQSHYSALVGQVLLRRGSTAEDRRSFIDPDNASVAAKVSEVAGDYSEDVNEYWRDCDRLYRWVVNNVEYARDSYLPMLPATPSGTLSWSEDCWRTPEETLDDLVGDCEDMALLLASMLISYNEGEYAVWLLEIRSEEPEVKAHLAVAFPVADGRLSILDPAGNYYTGYRQGRLQSSTASTAVRDWLSHWSTKMPGAEIVLVFSDSIDQEFSGNDEFLEWLSER